MAVDKLTNKNKEEANGWDRFEGELLKGKVPLLKKPSRPYFNRVFFYGEKHQNRNLIIATVINLFSLLNF